MREVLETLVEQFRPLLTEHGLTEPQWRVLRALESGVESQVELAIACVMQPASLTGVLARMERDGLVERRRATGDQRRKIVTTTAAGDALLERLAPEIDERYRRLTETMGATRLDALTDAAGEFLAALPPKARRR